VVVGMEVALLPMIKLTQEAETLSFLAPRAPGQRLSRRGQLQCSLTRRVFSTSPHGSRFTKSMPVSGVPVGGSRMEASIMRYSTFMGFI
jgi:hypothetical protein